MKVTSLIALPLFLALGLTLAACNNNAPPPAAPAVSAAADAEKAAAETKAADEAAAAEKAAADAKAAEAAAAKAAEDKAAADAAAAAKAAADAKAAEEKAAADAVPKLPATGLKPDTLLAVRAATDKIGYLGVWAAGAAACATVDQAGATGYVVITPISVRQGDAFTLVDAAPLSAGKATLTAGETTIEIAQSAPDQLTVNGAALVRCTL